MVPTIGRRMYFHAVHPAKYGLTCLDVTQPFDAGVIFVHTDTTVNLQVTDHTGVIKNFHRVEVMQDSHTRLLHDDYWVEWMPYQKEQAAKAKVQLPVSDATA